MSFLLINKPEGWTSFDVVAFIRNRVKNDVVPNPLQNEESLSQPTDRQRSLGGVNPTRDDNVKKQKKIKVGHAGTLDPFATGLLIVAVGREDTKKLDEFKKMPKTYIATITLGATSDTYDKTGVITACHPEFISGSHGMLKQVQHDSKLIKITKEQVLEILKTFTGKQLQIPPMFSAKKIKGQRLYDLARKGIEVDRQPNEIEVYSLELLDYTWPILKIEVQCSAGTYIRSLAHDIGQQLGTGAYCEELVRTQIGDYSLTNAASINNLK
jgi:tRNA pseudouridine55 synthase